MTPLIGPESEKAACGFSTADTNCELDGVVTTSDDATDIVLFFLSPTLTLSFRLPVAL